MFDYELSRREFTVLLGLTLARGPKAAFADTDDFLTRYFTTYSKKYPITNPLFSFTDKTFQFEGKTLPLNLDRFCFVNYDYSSLYKRFFIFNQTGTIEMSSLASHGITTGNSVSHLFSNTVNSNQSSLGIYVTGTHYMGDFGIAINLHGVCDSNNKAYDRRVVMHGANYCSPDHVARYGFLGRSLGCIALPKKNILSAYEVLKPGTLVIAKMDTNRKMTEALIPPTVEEKSENRLP